MSTTNSSKTNTSSVVRVDQLDIRDFSISPPKTSKDKKIVSYLNNKNSDQNAYETPNLFTKGLWKYEPGSGEPSYSISLSKYASNGESIENVEKFFSYLNEVDNIAISYIILNSQIIFKKQYTEEQRPIVEELFTRGVIQKVGDNGITYISIKLKIKKPDILIFEGRTNLNVRTFEDIENILLGRKTPIRAIFKPQIYFMGKKCGITYHVTQILIPERKIPKPLPDFAFSGYENEPVSSTALTMDVPVSSTEEVEKPIQKKEEEAEDSEEEEEEEEEEDEEEGN
jgi:hypothetical protein